jgi:hypothetical protein
MHETRPTNDAALAAFFARLEHKLDVALGLVAPTPIIPRPKESH